MNGRDFAKNVALIVAIVSVIFVARFVAQAAKPHLWVKVRSAIVTYDGRISPESRLYRSSDGDLLLDLQAEDEYLLFVVFPKSSKAGIPSASSFIELPGIAYSKDVPPPVVYLDDRVKVDTDFQFEIRDTSFQFNSVNGRRVSTTW